MRDELGESSSNELGVEDLHCGARASKRHRRLRRIERLDDDIAVEPTEERSVVLDQAIHHGLVRANKEQEDRSPGERQVPDRLEESVEAGAGLIGPWELVDDEDGGSIA